MTLIRSSLGAGAIIGAAIVFVAAFRAAAPDVEAASQPVSKEAVYAAFTVNLTRFISWPASALGPEGSPFLIGTFSRDPINEELDAAVRGENVNGHPLRTIRLHSIEDVRKCHVVFVSGTRADVGAVLAEAENRPILTVSDVEGFLARGGHVRFVPEPNRTGLQVSAVNLRASGLEARAQLLRVAEEP